MKDRRTSERWAEEFLDFMSSEGIKPPQAVSDRILAIVNRDLNPSAWLVFSRVSLIHLVVGTFSLMLCPQFGVGPFQHSGLMALLMRFGDHVCMFGCGALFVGMSALAASLLLRPEEVRVVRKTELLQFGVLSLLSIGAFLCAGASVIASLAGVWILGSILGGVASLELGWVIRSRFRKRLVHGL